MRKNLRGILAVALAIAAVVVIVVARIDRGGDPQSEVEPSPTALPTVGATPTEAALPGATAEPTSAPTSSPTRAPSPTSTVEGGSTAPSAPTPGPTATPTVTSTPTPTPTPTPPAAAGMAMAVLADDYGIPGGELEFAGYEPAEWPTSLLGCPGTVNPKSGKSYSAIAVQGWKVFISRGEETYEYHTDQDGTAIVTCDSHATPGPNSVNVAEAAALAGTMSVEISRFDSTAGGYRLVAAVEDPEEVARFVHLLDLEMPLEPRAECDPVMRIDYVGAGQTQTFGFWCGSDPLVLQGEQGFWAGSRGITAEEYGDLIGPYAAMVPLPGFPTR